MRTKIIPLVVALLFAALGYSQTPTINSEPADQKDVCPGSTVTFSVTATPGDATNDYIMFQWQYSPDGGTTWTDIGTEESGNDNGDGTFTSSLDVTASTSNNNYQYRCIVNEYLSSDNTLVGSSESAAAVLTLDGVAPTLTTQNITVYLDENGQASITPVDVVQSLSDNCTDSASINVTLSQSSFSCADLGDVSITVTATDESGNSVDQSATVTVKDNTAPTLTTQNFTVYLDANGQASITPVDVVQSLSDNCTDSASIEVTLSQSSFTCADLGDISITVTAYDASGNPVSQTATVTVVDNIAPVVATTQAAYTINMTGSSVTLQVVDVFDATNSSDNCGIVDKYFKDANGAKVYSITYNCDDVDQTITETLYAVDESGNEGFVNFDVTVKDIAAPEITASDYTAALDSNGNAVVTINDIVSSVTDNCGVDDTYFLDATGNKVYELTYSCSNIGEHQVTVYSDDIHGNQSTAQVIVSVVDNIKPTADVVNSYIAQLVTSSVTVNVSDLATNLWDNCNISAVTTYFDKDATGNLITSLTYDCADKDNTYNVSVYVEDGNGNVNLYPVSITVQDVAAPTLSTTGGTFYLDGNSVTVNATDIASATDNCGSASVFIIDANNNAVQSLTFYCEDLGDTTLTVIAVDESNNYSDPKQVVITIADNTAPVLTTTNQTLSLGDDGTVTIAANAVASATDNCTPQDLIDIYFLTANNEKVYTYQFDCGYIGDNTVTVYAEDASGNIAQANVTITVNDNTAPSLTTQNYDAYLDGNTVTVQATSVASATDNCHANVYFKDADGNPVEFLTFDCSQLGANLVTVYASDDYNEVSAQVEINVIDNTPPVITTNAAVSYDYTGTPVTITPQDLVSSVTDNCSTDIDLYFVDDNGNKVYSLDLACDNIGDNDITVYADDGHNNIAQATVTVTVNDKAAPDLNVLSELTVYLDDNGQASITSDDVVISVTDCDPNVQVSITPNTFTCDNVGTPVEVLVVATDMYGNSSQAPVTVTVEDTIAPQIITELADQEVNIDENCVFVMPDLSDQYTIVENCSPDQVVVSQSPEAGSEFQVGDQIEVSITATDVNNNTSVYSVIWTVVDSNAPVIVYCPSDTSLAPTIPAGYIVTDSIFDVVAEDCQDLTIFNDFNNDTTLIGDTIPVGDTTITWTVTDASGNEVTCSFSITVTEWTGLENYDFDVRVYPNPADYKLFVSLNNNVSGTVEVIDLTGKTLIRKPILSRIVELNVNDLASGTYTLRIITDNKVVIKRFIKR